MSRALWVTVFAILSSGVVEGSERVARLTIAGEGIGVTFVNSRQIFQAPNAPIPPVLQPFFDENTFLVHTAAEVDDALARTAADIDQRHVALTNNINATLQAQETRLRQDVLNAVDQLPQRVLADTAAQALKDAILTEIRNELAQMRQDLQSQIDALRAEQ